ncbi:hypothetical protein ACRYCC_26685 [Actinomadura scrupuli]|uniref:hypothetical protein n=1 Tax=Actinomadura scrupuli TaxID=559629 RepID=UPI003D9540A3
MSSAILTKIRGRYPVLLVAGAALAGIGLAAVPARAEPPEVIVASTLIWRTMTIDNPVIYRVDLPAGHWTVAATATGQNNKAEANSFGCWLSLTGNFPYPSLEVRTTIGPKPAFETASAVTAGTVTTKGSANWGCSAYNSTTSMSVFNVSIVATRVNSMTQVDLG